MPVTVNSRRFPATLAQQSRWNFDLDRFRTPIACNETFNPCQSWVDHCDLRALGTADGARTIQSGTQRPSQICRCRPVDCDAGRPSRRGTRRRKRRQLLGPRLLWKPRGHAAAAGLVAGEYLLPYLRIGRRRRRACARIHARQGSGQPYRQRKSEFERQRHRRSWLCDPDLCIRDAGARRPGVGVPPGSLWRRRHQPGGDLVRRGHGPVRQQRPLRAVRQHQRHDMGLWGSDTAILIALERRRPQLHDLCHGRHPGWRLPIQPPVEYWHRTRRDRRRRRLHLFQSADRPRIFRRARLHLQFHQ